MVGRVVSQGTMSVLFGCHSIVHCLIVIVAWKRWYGSWPNWWQTISILVHDIGHWGKDYLDNYEEKKRHAELGARVASFLFGQKGYNLVAGHNAYDGQGRSRLYSPDKYSWVIAPVWWMITNTFFEPRLVRKGCSRKMSVLLFKDAMRENMESGWGKQGHDIYMEQWGHYAA